MASLGADGLVAATPDGVLRAALDRPVAGNPTGAGDALVAGLAAGIADGLPWPDRLRHAVALAACAVRSPSRARSTPPRSPRSSPMSPSGPRRTMPLVPMSEVVGAPGRGLGAFNVIQLEQAEAIVTGAERAGTPVVLQISENCVAYHGALAPLGRAVLAVGRAAAVPVVAHLDHATSAGLVREAVGLGFGSVMFDASRLPHDANVASTAEVAARCHDDGVWVEAELGEIGGKDGVHAPHARTDPAEAAGYVAATGVDALAVAVGTSHAMLTRDTVLDLPLIERLAAAVPVPWCCTARPACPTPRSPPPSSTA